MMKISERYGRGGSLDAEWALRVSCRFDELVKEKRTVGSTAYFLSLSPEFQQLVIDRGGAA